LGAIERRRRVTNVADISAGGGYFEWKSNLNGMFIALEWLDFEKLLTLEAERRWRCI
jgi:hypothetical protein